MSWFSKIHYGMSVGMSVKFSWAFWNSVNLVSSLLSSSEECEHKIINLNISVNKPRHGRLSLSKRQNEVPSMSQQSCEETDTKCDQRTSPNLRLVSYVGFALSNRNILELICWNTNMKIQTYKHTYKYIGEHGNTYKKKLTVIETNERLDKVLI